MTERLRVEQEPIPYIPVEAIVYTLSIWENGIDAKDWEGISKEQTREQLKEHADFLEMDVDELSQMCLSTWLDRCEQHT